jgi:hypothetical protein
MFLETICTGSPSPLCTPTNRRCPTKWPCQSSATPSYLSGSASSPSFTSFSIYIPSTNSCAGSPSPLCTPTNRRCLPSGCVSHPPRLLFRAARRPPFTSSSIYIPSTNTLQDARPPPAKAGCRSHGLTHLPHHVPSFPHHPIATPRTLGWKVPTRQVKLLPTQTHSLLPRTVLPILAPQLKVHRHARLLSTNHRKYQLQTRHQRRDFSAYGAAPGGVSSEQT